MISLPDPTAMRTRGRRRRRTLSMPAALLLLVSLVALHVQAAASEEGGTASLEDPKTPGIPSTDWDDDAGAARTGPWLLLSDPRVEDGETARQVSIDLLEGAAALLRTFDFGHPERETGLLHRIAEMRGVLRTAPPEDLQVMADTMGPLLADLHHALKAQIVVMGSMARPEAPQGSGLALPLTPGFPALDPNLPDYPQISARSVLVQTFIEPFSEDTIRDILDFFGWIAANADIPLCVVGVNPDGRADRLANELVLDEVVANEVLNIIDDIAQDVCGGASIDIVIVSAGYGCNLCCIQNTLLTGIANLIHDSVMLCQDQIDGAEIEAAYQTAKKTFEGVEHVHGDVEALQGTANRILDIVTCKPVPEYLRGHGCDGFDSDCNGTIDDPGEDVYPPVFHGDGAISNTWFTSNTEARAAVEKAILATDDCRDARVSTGCTGTCDQATVTLTADDGLNSASLTVPVKVDVTPPMVSIPASLAGSCHTSVEQAELTVLGGTTIADDCTTGSRLDVRMDSTVTDCFLHVQIEAIDLAGKRTTEDVTVRVDTRAPDVEVNRLELAELHPACFDTVGDAEQAVLAVTRVSDNCTDRAALQPVLSSTGGLCELTVTASAADECGMTESDEAVVRVDASPPVVTAGVAIDSLWPANHKFVDVGLAYTAADDCDGEPEIRVIVTSDESARLADGAGGEKAPDAEVQRAPDGTVTGVLLRAERASSGNGRVYRITVEATDACGHVGSAFADVAVPPNASDPAVDDGQYHDATAGCF